MRDFIGTGIAENGVNKNVINILRVLLEDKSSKMFIPYDYATEKFGKIGDPRVHFYPKGTNEPAQIVDIQGHKERFNFSLLCLVNVLVEYYVQPDGSVIEENTEETTNVRLESKQVWRTYTVIRDGKLNMEQILVKLSEDSYKDLVAAGDILFLGDVKVDDSFQYNDKALYTLKLTDLPLVSTNWARPNVLNFHKMLRDCDVLSSNLSKARAMLKEASMSASSDADPTVYKESIIQHAERAGIECHCVSYQILPNPGEVTPTLLTESVNEAFVKDFKKMEKEYKDCKFRCECIKWAMESCESHRKSSYNWSDLYQKKKGSSKYYQEAIVSVDGVDHRLERCEYTKKF